VRSVSEIFDPVEEATVPPSAEYHSSNVIEARLLILIKKASAPRGTQFDTLN
jgi:hypothetical protein